MMSSKSQRERCIRIFKRLKARYPDARCTLEWKYPWQLLVSSILSPQCTDAVNNVVTKELWKKFPTVDALSHASVHEIERIVKPCGMFHVKARYVHETALMLRDRFHGKVPDSLSTLREFPGIGRKTGLVVMLEAFGKTEGIIVDTHNMRIVLRTGLSRAKGADAVETDLMKVVLEKYWPLWSHLMLFHGREVCVAKNPKCGECPIYEECDFERKLD